MSQHVLFQMILVAHGKLLELYRPDHAAGKMHSVLGESTSLHEAASIPY